MAKEVIIFCDESGNTGPNNLDPEQLFFVIAGWIVPEIKLRSGEKIIRAIKARFCPKAKEISFSNFKSKAKGVECTTELWNELERIDCIPLYAFTLKPFFVHSIKIKLFLNPHFNDMLEKPLDFNEEAEIARKLYDWLPFEPLELFAEWLRNPYGSDLIKILEQVINYLRFNMGSEIWEMLYGAMLYLKRNLDQVQREYYLNRRKNTVNIAILVGFLQMVEHFCRNEDSVLSNMALDKITSFEEDYNELLEEFHENEDFEIQFPNGSVYYTSLPNIEKLIFKESQECPMIQAADCLAGALSYILKKISRNAVLSTQEKDLTALYCERLLYPEPKTALSVLPTLTYSQLLEAATGPNSPHPVF